MSTHSRKLSSRAALPRRNTRGPLDDEDPLSASSSLASPATHSPTLSRAASTASKAAKTEAPDALKNAVSPEPPSQAVPHVEQKDLSFMLYPAVYHPLSQLDIPAPFRRPFPMNVTASANVSETLRQLDDFLAECNFLGAAFLAGSLLASGAVKPTDRDTIFRLLAVRYSCLELSGNVMLAAQEAKALEDLGSGFYYDELPEDEPTAGGVPERSPPRHIMPFSLRLQALRLQSIGFSDPRRGVSALYDVGLECRENIASTQNAEEDRKAWLSRLEEVGIRVVNALVEMGDLDCARRTLMAIEPPDGSDKAMWTFRMALLCLKVGLVERAASLAQDSTLQASEHIILSSLLAIAEDDLDKAVDILSANESGQQQYMLGLAKQNLAIAMLYKGEIERARSTLQSLIDEQESFQTLTINLATLYELSSDRSKDMKLGLASKLAAQGESLKQPRPFTNADFKL